MKALPLLKLLLLIALVALMQLLTTPSNAAETVAVEAGKPATSLGAVPETSSVILIGALGLMLMLRRRRLHA